jgi:O-antigen/teichoic acid export membrane protein
LPDPGPPPTCPFIDNYNVKEHTSKKRGQLSFPAIAIGGHLSVLLATEWGVASWLRPVGGEASKRLTESRQHPFCNFVSKGKYAGIRSRRKAREKVNQTEGNMAKPGSDGFAGRVKSALVWRSGSQILGQIITWASTFIVINLLNPADYGLFAMTQVILAFLAFLNGYGFASALIQAESVERFRLRQAFGLLLILNGALAALQFFGAPLAAAYYGQPIVADMLRVQALIYIATPFIALPDVMLSRALDFRRPALVNLVAALLGAATALGGALLGYGVWTLVIAPIVMFWTRAIGLTLLSRLLVWPSFDFRGAGQLFSYGFAVLASQFFWLIQTQSDVFIAGRALPVEELGLYTTALFLTQIIATKFVPPLNDVAFPAFARIQDDKAALRWNFLKAIRLIMLVTAPLYLGLAVSAEALIASVFQPKWAGMAPLVSLFALAMPFITLQILFAPLSFATGHARIPTWTALCGAIMFGAAFLIGVRFGSLGLACAWLISAPLLLIATVLLSRPASGVGVGDVIGAALPGLGCAALMAGIVSAVDNDFGIAALAAPARLALLVASGGAAYSACLYAFQRETLAELLRLVRRQPAI